MAKNWEFLAGGEVLVRNYSEKGVDSTSGKEYQRLVAEPLRMELNALFINVRFSEMDSVEKNIVLNGLRQKLDDAIAKSKDMKLSGKEQREVQDSLWKRISEKREWNLVSREGKKRGESVSLKLLVPALLLAGMSAEAISQVTGKEVGSIKKFIETGVDETEVSNGEEEITEE